jgi:tripartite-type tricarboxylate transporter receptor subunit TctC
MPRSHHDDDAKPKKTFSAPAIVAAALLAFNGIAGAAQFRPYHPLTMVVPFAAGGPTDLLGRVIAGRMTEVLGQNVVVENVVGAGGMIGSARVAYSAPDGYHFVLGTVGTHAQEQTLHKHPPYDASTDFTPVILIAEVPLVLETRKNLEVSNFREFVAYAKAHQGGMLFGSAGSGSATHLGCMLLNNTIGVKTIHVPYPGTAPALQDLKGGRIDYMCDVITTAKAPIESGAAKGIAILDTKRSPALPNLPTAAEEGAPKIVADTWNAIFLPKNTPAPIVKTLRDAALAAMHTPAVRERLNGLGAEIVPDNEATPEYLGDFVKSEIAKWAVPIKASGVSVE